MYKDSKRQWNVAVGCTYGCVYCVPSFQRQMKRMKPIIDKNGKKRGCQDCYDYIPHFHEDRITKEYCKKHFKKTKEDEFIWVCSSGDISFTSIKNLFKIFHRIEEYPDRTFFFQTKNPKFFQHYNFPKNVILGITLETNRFYPTVSKAPKPEVRYKDFLEIEHPRKIVTIEPIMQFDLYPFTLMIKDIRPERVYVGYDTRKCGLIEPSLTATRRLVEYLEKFTKVKLKYIPER